MKPLQRIVKSDLVLLSHQFLILCVLLSDSLHRNVSTSFRCVLGSKSPANSKFHIKSRFGNFRDNFLHQFSAHFRLDTMFIFVMVTNCAAKVGCYSRGSLRKGFRTDRDVDSFLGASAAAIPVFCFIAPPFFPARQASSERIDRSRASMASHSRICTRARLRFCSGWRTLKYTSPER